MRPARPLVLTVHSTLRIATVQKKTETGNEENTASLSFARTQRHPSRVQVCDKENIDWNPASVIVTVQTPSSERGVQAPKRQVSRPQEAPKRQLPGRLLLQSPARASCFASPYHSFQMLSMPSSKSSTPWKQVITSAKFAISELISCCLLRTAHFGRRLPRQRKNQLN